ncbi:MAG: hypothetical protein JXM70_17490 [Pirellulales bacterium]|nr:hypothetical protein [Pirellulales bacterium]
MFRLNKLKATLLLVTIILSALLMVGYTPLPAHSAEAKKVSTVNQNVDSAQKPNLHGLPIVISFPNVPPVPEKIKAAKPSPKAGAVLKNIPSYHRRSTSDGTDAAKSR